MRRAKLAATIMVLATSASVHITLAQSSSDVVASFKKYVADYMNSYKTDRREMVRLLGGGWAKEYFEPLPDAGIDVRKTDSLVSPYMGVVEFTLITRYTTFHKTRTEAEADNNFVQTRQTKHRHTYAYQDGSWVPKTRQNCLPMLDEWYECNEYDGCWELK